jgi:hypothetical protein
MATLTPTAPGLQSPDGRLYPDGLILAWRKQAPEGSLFPLALKVRQSFDTGWRVALTEAMAYGVKRLHIAIIPNWSHGAPDSRWMRAALRELRDLVTLDSTQVYVRLGNYRDGANEGCTFIEHAAHERDFGALLPDGFYWSVGDDRGMVAALDGWRDRAKIFAGISAPSMLEVQPYGETAGLTEDHPSMLRTALAARGWHGGIALVECHRWFKPQARSWEDFKRLAEAETGEYLLRISRACAAEGIGFMLFTGDTAFDRLDPRAGLNPAGLALFNQPRRVVAPWVPPLMRRTITTWRLR